MSDGRVLIRDQKVKAASTVRELWMALVTNCAPGVAARPDSVQYQEMERTFYAGFMASVHWHRAVEEDCVTMEQRAEMISERERELIDYTQAALAEMLKRGGRG